MLTLPSPFFYGVPNFYPESRTDYLLDASGEKVGYVFQATKTGYIQYIQFLTSTASNPQMLKVSLQGVDGSGLPNGSILGGGTAYGTVMGQVDAWLQADLGANKLSVTRGDWLAAVIEFNSTVGNMTFHGSPLPYYAYNKAYSCHYTGSWTKSQAVPVIALKYDDDAYNVAFPGGRPGIVAPVAPWEVGLAITPFVDMSVIGCYMQVDEDAAYALRLLGPDGSTVLESQTPSLTNKVATTPGLVTMFFAPRTLTAAQEYYVTCLPSGASAVQLTMISHYDTAMKAGVLPWGQYMRECERSDGGTWTHTDRLVIVAGLIVAGLEVSGGGGGRPEFRGANL